jgi:hypothetical protein
LAGPAVGRKDVAGEPPVYHLSPEDAREVLRAGQAVEVAKPPALPAHPHVRAETLPYLAASRSA